MPDRRADEQYRQIGAGFDQAAQLRLHPLKQSLLMMEIVYGVGGEAQFGEKHQIGPRRTRLAGQGQQGGGVGAHVRDARGGGSGCDPHQPLRPDRGETVSHCPAPPSSCPVPS